MKKRIKHHPIVGRLATRVRDCRTRMGLSQYDLAAKAGLSPNFVGRLERGEVAVGVDTLAALAEALAVDPGKLISAETGKPQAVAAVKAQLAAKIERLLTRDDLPALQSLSVIAGLVDNALARRNT